jgi:hypothetical protein
MLRDYINEALEINLLSQWTVLTWNTFTKFCLSLKFKFRNSHYFSKNTFFHHYVNKYFNERIINIKKNYNKVFIPTEVSDQVTLENKNFKQRKLSEIIHLKHLNNLIKSL